MSERLEKLRREIEVEKQLLLEQLGLSFTGPLIVRGGQDVGTVIKQRMARVPEPLRLEVSAKLTKSVIALPWLHDRAIGQARP